MKAGSTHTLNGPSAFFPASSSWLDASRGALAAPIRAEVFGAQRFAQHGLSLGSTHRAAWARSGEAVFFPRLQSNVHMLREAHRFMAAQAATGEDISPAAEWLLDNFHLIEAQTKAIRDGLPRSYFRSLPALLDEPQAGLPRIYGVAWAFVAHTDSAFNEELLVAFLVAYQQTRELNLSELWALPTTLRVVLVENLRRLAETVATTKAARDMANVCCDKVSASVPDSLDALRLRVQERGIERVFLSQVAQRLRDTGNPATGLHSAWLQAWMDRAMPDVLAAQSQQGADEAADNLSVSNAVTSLRAIDDVDWVDIIARASAVMGLMLGSPLFAAEEAGTRDQTLHGIEWMARHSQHSELDVTQTLLALMRTAQLGGAVTAHARHWLQGQGRSAMMQALGMKPSAGQHTLAWLRGTALFWYLSLFAILTAAGVAWLWQHGPAHAATWTQPSTDLLWLLLAWPVSEAVLATLNRLVSESTRPQHLPRLALLSGIPAAHRVMVVIPCMISSKAACASLAHQLSLHHLANPQEHAQYALLSDWPDAPQAQHPDDEALLNEALAHIHRLNALYPRSPQGGQAAPRFILLHRARRHSQSEQCWMGWERKRGKLEQLVNALSTGQCDAFLDLGEASRIAENTPYIVTLDSDTQLPPGRLQELVGVAAHPDNQPCLDDDGHVVVRGYGILQPRVVTALPSRQERTRFHWLFAGHCGMDPYSAASSEVYQDLFGEGSFNGKGLLHVKAMQAVLSGRLPEGQVLSHDLLEGALARCAAVSDITLMEAAPGHADVASLRWQRWTRGDWQLLPFLLSPRHHHVGVIHVWKMLDNLRRSLLAPVSCLILVLSWLGTGLLPAQALMLVWASATVGPMLGALANMTARQADMAALPFYRQVGTDLARAVLGGVWHVAQLLRQSLDALDAITRALYRMLVSHRHLLQWATGDSVVQGIAHRLGPLCRQHAREPLVATLLCLALSAMALPNAAWWLSLCLLWGASPIWTWWASRPQSPSALDGVQAQDRLYLAGVARDTWRYFERCVTTQDRHLPPDNLQTSPLDMVAHRTSPTNIGLYLLSAACAREFGWIGTLDFIQRLEATLGTVEGLQRHRGHLLNWYDTQSGEPLLPWYVSTVDSGNLSAHLLAVSQACLELADNPLPEKAAQDALNTLRQRLQWPDAQQQEHRNLLDDHRSTLRSAELDQRARRQVHGPAQARLRLLALAQRCEALAWQPDFTFLYHPKRHLLHIGFRVSTQELDSGFYDLLASEARLTSLLAIAKGDVAVRHWAALARPHVAVGTQTGLMSWSGSMFEYLMPCLVMAEPWGSALHSASMAAVCAHRAHGRELGLPWGHSESAYAGRDDTLAYQYAPQGVARLALRRTPPDECVVAPYASVLAAMGHPTQACRNLMHLDQLGARGRYGFIDALDFSPTRQAGLDHSTPVHTFMAHHQGMSIVALANVLCEGVAQRWGMAHPRLQAVSTLMHEWTPHQVATLTRPNELPRQMLSPSASHLLRDLEPGHAAIEPTHLLSNGRYHVSLRPHGAGTSRWGQALIGRQRDDALRDECGHFFFVRTPQSPQLSSLTRHPANDPDLAYQCTFHADRVSFDTHSRDWSSHITVWVSPEDDIEFRQVELHNLSDEPLDIELLSSFEPTLCEARADASHPAFSQLFVQAQWLSAMQALVFERTPRLSADQGLHMAHFLADTDPQIVSLGTQTSRLAWLGRNHHVSQALAQVETAPHEDQVMDTGLDPVCSLSVRLLILPHAKVQLTFGTAASDHRGTLLSVVDKYRQASHVQRASLMSATMAGIRLRAMRIATDNIAAMQALTTALSLNLTRPAGLSASIQCETIPVLFSKCSLWRLGISGDRPILLLTVATMQGLGLVRSLAQALRWWSWGGLACDLVVVNEEARSYDMALHRELVSMRSHHQADEHSGPSPASDTPGINGFHVVHADELALEEVNALQGLARVRLHADGRTLPKQVQSWLQAHEVAFDSRLQASCCPLPLTGQDTVGSTPPTGQFESEGQDFGFDVSSSLRPLRPWTNVMANPDFGAHLTEAGGGYSWATNSRLHQITAWSNDPVSDPPSEWLLLQDLRTGQAWSATPSAWAGHGLHYRVTHSQGHTRITHQHNGIEVSSHWCIDPHLAIKQVQLSFHNTGRHAQSWRVVGMAEWIMGAQRADRASCHTSHHRLALGAQSLHVLLCTQLEHSDGMGGSTAFLACLGPLGTRLGWTCDRREWLDAEGHMVLPDHFAQACGRGLDPCATLSAPLSLAPQSTQEQVFWLGHADTAEAALVLARQAVQSSAARRLQNTRAHWDGLLNTLSVSTPDPLFDALVNRWLPYQTLSCRLWAKSGFYQAGGATGFRDQLQDAMAMTWADPGILRQQIVLCASRQFMEGDVQHWWHRPSGVGVRTHFSDDLLWLPHACVHLLRHTSDARFLDETVPFIEGTVIPPGAEDAYGTPQVTAHTATVYEHAALTLDHSLRSGAHGLPLMGSGDWNDGMNRVGHEGRGESVWLAWFLCRLIADFAPLAQARGESQRADTWLQAAHAWREALDTQAWDGLWFKRAFLDNGQAIGSHLNQEGRIDLIAQAWSVLSGVADEHKQDQAMAAVDAYLVDPGMGLLRLLTPPFSCAPPEIGYIQSYPAGVRENGAQYAHAGVWALMAWSERARHGGRMPANGATWGDQLFRYFSCLSPAHRAAHPTRGPVYGVEPYVMAADVYSVAPHAGQGGWSWYTGSAGLMHRAAVECILGLKVHTDASQAHCVSLWPCLPSDWPHVELRLKHEGTTLRFIVMRSHREGLVEAGAPAGCLVLLPGDPLVWAQQRDHSCFVVPIG